MERSKEEDDELYISLSKENIDNYINNDNYRAAFGILLMTLDRLDNIKQKNYFITHYLNKYISLNNFNSK